MDVKWRMPKEIKQEEPVEYYLISTISDDQRNVALDAYTPQASQLEVNKTKKKVLNGRCHSVDVIISSSN